MFSTMTYPQFVALTRDQSRDGDIARWTDREVYQAINSGVRAWQDKVRVPYVYEFDMSASTAEIILPNYVQLPLRPQYQNDLSEWVDIATYDIEMRDDHRVLILPFHREDEGRIIWWGKNSVSPIESALLTANRDTDDTSLTVTNAEVINETGVIQVNQELMTYNGVTRTSTTRTLNNLQRACFGSTAASHLQNDPVYWALAVHREDLFEQLMHYVMGRLYVILLRGGHSGEKESFERMLNFHMQEEKAYWRQFTKAYTPDYRLSKKGLGEPLDYRHRWPASGDRWGNP